MFYEYGDGKLHYEMIGEGKPVLMLHGMTCDLNMMKGCMEPIFTGDTLEKYQRIYVDLPGMGQSVFPLDCASADRILEVLEAFIRDTVQGDFLLAGESYGGYLARGILSKLCDRIAGMLLLCPVAIPERSQRTVPETKVKFWDGQFLDSLSSEERRGFFGYAVVANKETYRRYQQEIQPGIALADPVFAERLEENYAFTWDVDARIRELGCTQPVQFICGRQDDCVGYQDLWNLMEDYERSAFSVVDMAGHNLQIEQPEMFGALVRNWLNMAGE